MFYLKDLPCCERAARTVTVVFTGYWKSRLCLWMYMNGKNHRKARVRSCSSWNAKDGPGRSRWYSVALSDHTSV